MAGGSTASEAGTVTKPVIRTAYTKTKLLFNIDGLGEMENGSLYSVPMQLEFKQRRTTIAKL